MVDWELYYDRFAIARPGDFIRWTDSVDGGDRGGVVGVPQSANGGGNIKYGLQGEQFATIPQECIYYISTPDGHVFYRYGDHWTIDSSPKNIAPSMYKHF